MAEHCAVNADVPVRLRLVTPIKGLWPRGEAADFYSVQRRFESCRAHQYCLSTLTSACRAILRAAGGASSFKHNHIQHC